MKNLSVLLLFFLFSNIYSQENVILGKWIFEKATHSDGSELELTHPLYSTKLIYYFAPNSLFINGVKTKASFEKNIIKLNFLNLRYCINDNYLTITSDIDKLTYYFVKEKKFLEKYPEFLPKTELKEGRELVKANEIIEPVFFNNVPFSRIFFQDIFATLFHSKVKHESLSIQFIVNKENKVENFKIKDSNYNDKEKEKITNAFLKTSSYFVNTYGKDIFLEYQYFLDAKKLKNNQIYTKEIKKISEYFNKKDFENTIKEFKNLEKNKIEEYKKTGKEKIYLGISYLAVGKNEEACNTFNEIGGITDFSIRNYLLNFCQKK